jgi:hypothetical protein
MKFEYNLGSSGWAEAVIEDKGREVKLFVSFLNDALGELTDVALSLIQDTENEMTQEVLIWQGEPWQYRWQFDKVDDLLKISIFYISDTLESDAMDDEEMVFSTTCHLRDFVRILTKDMTRLLQEHGFVGYQQNWMSKDFPISNYLKFTQYLKTTSGEYDALTSNGSFVEELAMLKKLANSP